MADIVSLQIDKLADGGYIVTDGSYMRNPNYAALPPRFAASKIEDALAYIGRQLEPPLQLVPEGFDNRPGAINKVGR